MATRMLICLMVSALLNLAGPTYHACRADEDEQAKAAAHLKHFLAKVDLVVSGECDVTTTFKVEAEPERDAFTHRFTTAFDYAKNRHRWYWLHADTPTFYAINEEALYFWSAKRPRDAYIYPKDGARGMADEIYPLDLRYAGLAGLHSVYSRIPFAEHRKTTLDALAPVSCKKDGDAFLCVFMKGERLRYTWRFESRQDGMPSELLIAFAQKPGGPFESAVKVNVQWEKHGKTWRPIDWVIVDGAGTTNFCIKLRWDSLNESIPERTFDLRGFVLEPGTEVWDMRNDPATLERIIGPG